MMIFTLLITSLLIFQPFLVKSDVIEDCTSTANTVACMTLNKHSPSDSLTVMVGNLIGSESSANGNQITVSLPVDQDVEVDFVCDNGKKEIQQAIKVWFNSGSGRITKKPDPDHVSFFWYPNDAPNNKGLTFPKNAYLVVTCK